MTDYEKKYHRLLIKYLALKREHQLLKEKLNERINQPRRQDKR